MFRVNPPLALTSAIARCLTAVAAQFVSYRFSDGAWEYLTAGQDNWEPVRFPDILTDFGPYTAVADS